MNIKNKTLSRNCPVCRNKNGQILHTQRFTLNEGNFLPSIYDVVSCCKCGFVFADTTATQVDYDRYYKEMSKYESLSTASGSGLTTYDQNRLSQTVNEITRYFPEKNNHILDVVCANGGLLLEMQKIGYKNLTGLDPSPVCVDIINKNGINAVVGGIYNKNNFSSKFDGILLTHVLEHVYDVRGAIKNLLSWLEDGGKLYIEVPDASRYKDFFIMPFYFFDVEHINHFDEVSLRNLFVEYDGAVIKVGQKDMTVSETNFYPSVYIIFQKFSVNNKIKPVVTSSIAVKESVLKYIDKSSLSLANPNLEKLVANSSPVIVWGAGQATQRLLSNTDLGKANILFFVDNDEKKHNSKIKDKRVVSPMEN